MGIHLSSPLVMILVGMLATIWSMDYLKKLTMGMREIKPAMRALSGFINGLLLYAAHCLFYQASPLILLLGSPATVIIYLYLNSKDVLYTYLYLYHKFVMNFMCIYWLVASVVGLLPVGTVPTEAFTYKGSILSLSLLLSSGWVRCLSRSHYYPFNELYSIIHSKKRGRLFFLYLTTCDIFLIVSTIILSPLLTPHLQDTKLENMIYLEIFIKTLLIFSCSYLILFIQSYEERQRQENKAIQSMLEKERSYRNNVQKKGLLYFLVNISKNKLEEGEEFFTAGMLAKVATYEMMVDRFVEKCIHPSYQKKFKQKNQLEFFSQLLQENSHFSQLMRVSPKGLLSCFHFSDEMDWELKETKKQWIWIKVDYIVTQDIHTKDIYAYIAAFNVDNEVREHEKLKISATIDGLTGIYNRAALEETAHQQLLDNAAGAMLLLDVDNFKKVNDILGHPKGDELLKEVARVLREVFREKDILGRLGGDEFCVLISGNISQSVVEARAQDINQRCRRTYYSEKGEPIKTSVSIGIALCTESCRTYDSLYKCADQALYQTKSRGKDGYTVYAHNVS